MSLFDRFRRRPWSLEGVRRPWGDEPSLYEFVRSCIDAQTGRFRADDRDRLPDDKTDGGIRWAAGALDGVMGHHGGGGDERLRVKQVMKAVRDLLTSATEANLAHLYRLSKRSVLGVIDPVIEAIVGEPRIDVERLHEVGRMLAVEAPDRETVKFGIALLGIVRGPDDGDVLTTLGLHDEFTLFSAVAIGRQNHDAERRLWELAKRVDGWGRIQIVERLAGTENPDLRAWFLREGFRNSIMNEYLAYTCATAGRLLEALRTAEPDDALLIGAAEILSALSKGGPAEDLASYRDAQAAVSAWLDHVERKPVVLKYVEALDALARRDEICGDAKQRIESMRTADSTLTAISDGLRSNDDVTFGLADQAAKARGIDTFAEHATRFQEGKGWLGYHLFRLLEQTDLRRIDAALEIAAMRIDLERLATGSAKDMELSPGSEPHQFLDSVLQELARFPEMGGRFVLAGLRSPVVRNRNMALRALAAWGSARWSPEVRDTLQTAARIEPDDDVKARFERVLAGGPYDDAVSPD